MLHHFQTSKTILAEAITPQNFAQFGGVISSSHQLATAQSSSANYGTATKLFQVSPVQSGHRDAKANWNLFRCSPPTHLLDDHRDVDDGLTYPCKVLERHPCSSQTFLPLGRPKDEISYMVIVAPSDIDTTMPLVDQARAFVCRGDQAVTYGMGTWHAPMIALEKTTDFAVLIHETGQPHLDCEEVSIDTLTVEFTLTGDEETVDATTIKRKPQTEEEFQQQLAQYREQGPPVVNATGQTGDTTFDLKQLKYTIEREYYAKNWAKVVELVDSNPTEHKVGAELQEIKRRAQQRQESSA